MWNEQAKKGVIRQAGAALLLAGSALAAAPAQAQGPFVSFYYSRWHLPAEIDIPATLAEQGYRRVEILRRRGDVFVVEAISPQRQPVRLIVDAQDGEVLERFAIANLGEVTDRPGASRINKAPAKKSSQTANPSSGPANETDTRPLAALPVPPRRPASAESAAGPRIVAPARPSSQWAPINSVPVAPLD